VKLDWCNDTSFPLKWKIKTKRPKGDSNSRRELEFSKSQHVKKFDEILRNFVERLGTKAPQEDGLWLHQSNLVSSKNFTALWISKSSLYFKDDFFASG
jgi:hypothetical protein